MILYQKWIINSINALYWIITSVRPIPIEHQNTKFNVILSRDPKSDIIPSNLV